LRPSVTDDDIKIIAQILEKSIDDFKKEYIETDDEEDNLFKDKPYRFLKDKNVSYMITDHWIVNHTCIYT